MTPTQRSLAKLRRKGGKKDPHKDAYIAGCKSGVQLGFELAMRSIEKQMAHLKLRRGL